MLEQERHKREEFQQIKVCKRGGAEAHAGAGEIQERGVPADEGKEYKRLQKLMLEQERHKREEFQQIKVRRK